MVPAFAQVPALPVPNQVPAGSFPSLPAADHAVHPSQSPSQSPSAAPSQSAPEVQPTTSGAALQTPTPQAPQMVLEPAAQPPTAVRTSTDQQPVVVTMPASQTHAFLPPPQTPDPVPSLPPYDFSALVLKPRPDHLGSTYIPVDSIIYPMALRLYSLGYLDTIFISMRPWTRRSLLHALEQTSSSVNNGGDEQAQQIFARLMQMLIAETPQKGFDRGRVFGLETGYTRLMGIAGIPLRDSFHLGQTIANDYGRPYAKGLNNITGFSTVNEWNRFSLNVRGEYQHAPQGDSYTLALANYLSCNDYICPYAPPNAPQATIPYGSTLNAQNPFRLVEASLSVHLLGHEFSGGKTDAWMGPGLGGGMAWSNNAENIYSFRINRVEPLHIPYLSALLGPIRYDFFVGSLKGHTAPNSPWVHAEMFSFRPSPNFEFGFNRTVIWGGKDHSPITLHTFLKSFFDINDTTFAEKFSRNDPGARFTTFNFSWRLPFLRHYVTLYTDSIAHDDVTPISAPRRAAYRPGIYLSQIPGIRKMDLRVEAASTDISTLRSDGGHFNYFEGVQTQGYTNKGFIMGDWIGREAKGGQAWLTYHLSGDEWVQLEYLNKKTPKDFIPQGTTQNEFKVDVVKHLGHNVMVDAWVQFERWKAPVYKTGPQNDTVIAAQFTWHPRLHTIPVAIH